MGEGLLQSFRVLMERASVESREEGKAGHGSMLRFPSLEEFLVVTFRVGACHFSTFIFGRRTPR